MRQHAIGRTEVARAALLVVLAAISVVAFALGGCRSSGPTPTPTRAPSIIVVTLTAAPPTATPPPTAAPPTVAQPTAEQPTAAPTMAITVQQPTSAPATPAEQQTVEPYPAMPTPTETPEGYPAP
jgi:hypothetical protein